MALLIPLGAALAGIFLVSRAVKASARPKAIPKTLLPPQSFPVGPTPLTSLSPPPPAVNFTRSFMYKGKSHNLWFVNYDSNTRIYKVYQLSDSGGFGAFMFSFQISPTGERVSVKAGKPSAARKLADSDFAKESILLPGMPGTLPKGPKGEPLTIVPGLYVANFHFQYPYELLATRKSIQKALINAGFTTVKAFQEKREGWPMPDADWYVTAEWRKSPKTFERPQQLTDLRFSETPL